MLIDLTHEQNPDETPLAPQAPPGVYAIVNAAFVESYKACQQYVAVWHAYLIETLMRRYEACQQYFVTWCSYTSTTLMNWYTHCLNYAFIWYTGLKECTTSTDYYAGQLKRWFLAQYTVAKGTVYCKTSCSLGWQQASYVLLDTAVGVMILVFLVAISNRYMSTRLHRVARILYISVFVSHMAFVECIEDILVTLLGAVSFALLALLIVSNSIAISAHLQRTPNGVVLPLIRRMGLAFNDWFIRPATASVRHGRQLLIRVFVPWARELVIMVRDTLMGWLLAPAVRVESYWQYYSEPANEDYDMSEPSRNVGAGQASLGNGAPSTTTTGQVIHALVQQQLPGATPATVVPTHHSKKAEISIDVRDESSSPVQSRKKYVKHGKARKKIVRRDNEDKAITHGGWRSWFNCSNFSNPMQIFDKQTGYREASLHKQYIEKEKSHHESIAQAEKRFNQMNSIAKLELEAAYLREQIESGASMQTSSGITTSPSYIASSSQNDKDSTHAVHGPKTKVQQATESAHKKSASVNAKPAVTHQEPESTHQEPSPDHQEPNAANLPFNAIPQTPPIETPRPALPTDTARHASQLDLADFALPARPIRNQAKGVDSREEWANRILGGPSLLTRLRRQQQPTASDSVGGSNNDDNNSRGLGDKGKGKNESEGDGKIEGNIGVKDGGKDGAETDAKDGNKDDRKADQHDGKNDDGDESDNDDGGENDAKGGGKVAVSSGPTDYQANPTEHATNDFLMDVDSAPTPAQKNKGPSSSFQNQPKLLQSLGQLPLPSFGQIPDVDAVGDDSVMADGSAAEGAAVENNDDDQAQTDAMQAELDTFFDQAEKYAFTMATSQASRDP
ncbi:hypothetical protein IQ06DRAFT_335033 [Phaeosphaeriaceae sp. SRC1lsM3a]|nr:hypothetical protein IQ06DRAFT_335033 [Stagonospora sp. SRC1lsM3a]